MTDYSGRGDPARSIELLWRTREPTRGPKPGLTIDQIVDAAVGIADADGLDGLSMRNLADRLGVGTMSLYRYVPSKAELLDVMVDSVSGETARHHRGGWRQRLEHIARENYQLFRRHPWLLHVVTTRPPLGPGIIAKYDDELRAIDGIGLSDVEMDSVLALLMGYVHGAALSLVETAKARTGVTDDEWWTALAPHLERVFDDSRFPLAARVGTAATDYYRGVADPEHAFEFGLQRVLDGVAALVERRAAKRRPRKR
jgi:AcrR family transcriptional regulator